MATIVAGYLLKRNKEYRKANLVVSGVVCLQGSSLAMLAGARRQQEGARARSLRTAVDPISQQDRAMQVNALHAMMPDACEHNDTPPAMPHSRYRAASTSAAGSS